MKQRKRVALGLGLGRGVICCNGSSGALLHVRGGLGPLALGLFGAPWLARSLPLHRLPRRGFWLYGEKGQAKVNLCNHGANQQPASAFWALLKKGSRHVGFPCGFIDTGVPAWRGPASPALGDQGQGTATGMSQAWPTNMARSPAARAVAEGPAAELRVARRGGRRCSCAAAFLRVVGRARGPLAFLATSQPDG